MGFIRDSCGNCRVCHVPKLDNFCTNVEARLIPVPKFGGFATHVQAPSKWAFPIPSTIPENICPPLLCAGATVWAPLKRHFGANKVCGIAGIGGLGHLGIMFSSKLGMKTVAVSTSEEKRAEALSYGANVFVNSNDKE